MSANEQGFCVCVCVCVCAQIVVGLLQTTRIQSYQTFVFSQLTMLLRQLKKNQNHLNRDGTSFFFFLFFTRVDAPHVYVRALALGCFYSHISTRNFCRRALTASVDSFTEIKSAPSVA